MEDFEPGEVYKNLIKMMGYRKVVLKDAVLDAAALTQKLNHYEFVTIQGERGTGHNKVICIIILIKPDSKYSTKSGDFKRLFKGLPKVRPDEPLDVMFVSNVPLTVHIKKHLQQFKVENPNYFVEDYTYSYFLIEAPKHKSVPEHIVASEEEVEEFCRMHFTIKDRFPKINQHDVQAVWLGLRPGDVVKIIRMSETSGRSIAYRVCVK